MQKDLNVKIKIRVLKSLDNGCYQGFLSFSNADTEGGQLPICHFFLMHHYFPKVLEISVLYAENAGIIAAKKPIINAPTNKLHSSTSQIFPEKV